MPSDTISSKSNKKNKTNSRATTTSLELDTARMMEDAEAVATTTAVTGKQPTKIRQRSTSTDKVSLEGSVIKRWLRMLNCLASKKQRRKQKLCLDAKQGGGWSRRQQQQRSGKNDNTTTDTTGNASSVSPTSTTTTTVASLSYDSAEEETTRTRTKTTTAPAATTTIATRRHQHRQPQQDDDNDPVVHVAEELSSAASIVLEQVQDLFSMEELQELVASRRPSSETVHDPPNTNTDGEKEGRKEEHEDETSPTLLLSSVPARTTTTEDDDADPKEPCEESEDTTTKVGDDEIDHGDEDRDMICSVPASDVSHSSERTLATTGLLLTEDGHHLEGTTSGHAGPIVPTLIPTLRPSGLGFDAATSIPDVDSNVDRSKCQDEEEETAAVRVDLHPGADADVQGDVTAAADGIRNGNTEEFLLIPTFPGGDVTQIALKQSFLLTPVIPGRTTKILWRSRL